jgi:hypothetical protein
MISFWPGKESKTKSLPNRLQKKLFNAANKCSAEAGRWNG